MGVVPESRPVTTRMDYEEFLVFELGSMEAALFEKLSRFSHFMEANSRCWSRFSVLFQLGTCLADVFVGQTALLMTKQNY